MRFRRSSRRHQAAPAPPACSSRAQTAGADTVVSCPGCGADSAIVASAIAYRTLNEGAQSRACETCESVTIVIEPGMVCPACEELYADVNARLRERFAVVGPGDPDDAPCVGYGKYVSRPNRPGPALYHDIGCQGCDAQFALTEREMPVGQAVHIACGRCRAVTVVPSTVWCPECGLHLRKRGIPELVREANRTRR